VVLFVAAAMIFASGAAQSHLFSVFVGPISRDLGISATAVASAYAFATLVASFGLPFMGRVVDRYGARGTGIGVVVALGFACLAFGAVGGGLTLALGFAALRFLGQGGMMMNASNLVAQWFSRRRGTAMSLMALGFSLSMAVHPPLAQWLVDGVGWRQAWLWIGLSTWALMLPLLLLFAHSKPEPLGLAPDGGAAPASRPESAEEAARHRADLGLTLSQALRTPTFWFIAAGLFSISMLVTGLFFHQVSIFRAHGLDAATAARIFPVSALVMVLAMPVYGRLLDRFPTERMFALGLLVMSASLVAMTQVQGLASALVYAGIFGVNNAVSMTLFGYLWPRYFGRRHLGAIQGTGQTIGIVGASVGPLPLGIAYDLFGAYNATLLVLALIPVACAGLTLFIRAPKLTA
jgi:MFS family permease